MYGPSDKGAFADLKVAIAGPLAHLPLAGIFAIMYVIVRKPDMDRLISITIYFQQLEEGFIYTFATVCRVAFGMNIILCIGHILIPVYPLDGVRIWAGALVSMGVGLNKSARLISVAGMLMSSVVAIYGCVVVFNRNYDGGITEILLGGFGVTSSKILYDLVKEGRLREDPVFGRACYGSTAHSIESRSASTGSSVTTSIHTNEGSNPIPNNAEII